jgi:hypothetical protein
MLADDHQGVKNGSTKYLLMIIHKINGLNMVRGNSELGGFEVEHRCTQGGERREGGHLMYPL